LDLFFKKYVLNKNVNRKNGNVYSCVDNCKKSADEDTMYSCWNDEVAAKDVAMEANYITEGDNYCPKMLRV
jgi:hypothetical protein